MRSITKYKGMRIVSLIMHSTISLLLLRLIFFFFFFSFCNYCTVLYSSLIFSIKPRHRSDLVSSKGKYKNEGYPTPPSGQSTGCGLRTRRRINCTEHFQNSLIVVYSLRFRHQTFIEHFLSL